eukprot:857374-Heterocapsa_arctica.AAC.1
MDSRSYIISALYIGAKRGGILRGLSWMRIRMMDWVLKFLRSFLSLGEDEDADDDEFKLLT